MKVYKIADLVDGVLKFRDDFPYFKEVVEMLRDFPPAADVPPGTAWKSPGTTWEIAGKFGYTVWRSVSVSDAVQEPVSFPVRQLVFYRNQLFVAENLPKTAGECSEIAIEVKKRVHGETSEPTKPMRDPPGVPEGYVRLWVNPTIAIELGHAYAGTDAFVPAWDDWRELQNAYDERFVDTVHPAFPWSILAKRHIGAVSVDGLLYELDKLTGLSAVKREMRSLVNYLRVQQLRKLEGLPPGKMTMHLVFTGNPGTGKTTVARLLAKIYKAMGFLPEGQLVETDRGGLVGEYLGHTAPKTMQVIQQALGGVLFIDEAYALARTSHGQKDMFGLEAIDTLLKAMEDNRDRLVVIVAGYPTEMKEFIASNPGLRSRFTRYIDFPDYTSSELMEIFEQQASEAGYVLKGDARDRAAAILKAAHEKRGQGFGNGRWVRTMFERASLNLSDRIASHTNITRDRLTTLEAADIENLSD
jgi:Cdc6-like AAA superfamily ATPase